MKMFNVKDREMKLVLIFSVTLFLVSVGAYALEDEAEPFSMEQAEILNKIGVLELDCYEQKTGRLLALKIDLPHHKVIGPSYIKWGKFMTYRDTGKERLLLVDDSKEPEEFYTIYRDSKKLSICRNDYVSGRCETFQCYNKNSPLF